MKIELKSRAILDGGQDVLLTVCFEEGEKKGQKKYRVPCAVFDKMNIPTGRITYETLCEIEFADEQYRAIRKAFDLLAYGRNSSRALVQKLHSRGFGDEAAEGAARYMLEHGYIKEDEDVIREVDCAFAKLLGKRRILMVLHDKGYDDGAVAVARAYMENLDFVENCVKLVRAKYRTIPKDEHERQKVIAGLVRHGYSFTEIKAAVKIVEHYVLPGRL